MDQTMYGHNQGLNGGSIFGFIFGMVFVVALLAFVLTVMWKFYVKAGRRGWESFIPIYNTYALVKIAGRPGWWTIFLFIPLVNLVISIIMALDIADTFKKSAVFGIFGLFFFSFIGYAILALGDATYTNPAASGDAIQQ